MKQEAPVCKGQVYVIEISGLGHSGEGVGRYEGFTVFIPFALPGERVEARILQVKKNYAVGKLKRVLSESPDRIAPPCAVYERCGGCQLQHLNVQAQLGVKRKQVVDALRRIGGQAEVVVHPVLGAARPWQYRNKMQFPVGTSPEGAVVGCYARGTHAVIDAPRCLIQEEMNNRIAAAVRNAVRALRIPVYDETTGRGVIRHVVGRTGKNGQAMAVLVTATRKLPYERECVERLRAEIPQITGILQNINDKPTNVVFGEETRLLWGSASIQEEIGSLTFEISPRSFFQVNTAQAAVLYHKALEYAALTGEEIVVDAYCGTGTITLFLAQRAKRAYGIEIVASAVEDAKKNALNNGIHNVTFLAGDACSLLPKLYREDIRPDVIVADPPRAGCERAVLETFAAMHPARIVYVSCNPASLARDSAVLNELSYELRQVQPVDMFPQTAHVEVICKFVKKDIK